MLFLLKLILTRPDNDAKVDGTVPKHLGHLKLRLTLYEPVRRLLLNIIILSEDIPPIPVGMVPVKSNYYTQSFIKYYVRKTS